MKTLIIITVLLCSYFSIAQKIDILEIDSLPGMSWSDSLAASPDTLNSNTLIYLNDMPMSSYTINFKFKYLGESRKIIQKAFTGDPHFISNYPREPLLKDSIYTFRVSFYNRSRPGKMNKTMGFLYTDGTRTFFRFKGNVIMPEEE